MSFLSRDADEGTKLLRSNVLHILEAQFIARLFYACGMFPAEYILSLIMVKSLVAIRDLEYAFVLISMVILSFVTQTSQYFYPMSL